jgi:PAS domain S-box-containing protein
VTSGQRSAWRDAWCDDVPVADGLGQESVESALLDVLTDAVAITDTAGQVVLVNSAAERLLGVRREALVGRPVSEALFGADDRDAFREVSQHALAGDAWSGDLDVVRLDGSTLVAHMTCAPVRHAAEVTGLVCVFSEVGDDQDRVRTAQRLTDRLTGLGKVAAELAVAEDLQTVTDVVVTEAANAVGATVGSLSLLADPDTLILSGLHGGRAGAAARWTRYSVHANTPAGEVARTGEPLVLIGQDAIRQRYPDLERAAEGERSMVVLPLRLTGRTIGVVSWSFPGRRRIDIAEMGFYAVVADTCAQAIERIRAQQESARQAARVRFLADATTKLSESLDYQSTLAEVAHMAVPEFADWCAIDLVEDGRLHRLAVEHIDPGKVALALELQERYPARPEEGGVWSVVRTGEPLLVPEVTDEMVAPTGRNDEHRRLLLQLQLRSVLLVPLIARGSVLGVMTWVMAESDRRYEESDLPFATDLARRAAIAIDNSLLHTQTREAAVRLQHAVLPDLPDAVPGWHVASHYSPAGRTEVGGDFFDVIPLGGDRLVVFVGDVMGRGVQAAAAMAQTRAAIRAYVADDPEPSAVLAKLDRLFAIYDLGQLVTMVYLLIDHDGVTMMNAGHPPPVLRHPDGQCEQAPSDTGPPLGAEVHERAPVRFSITLGDLLLAFTDGLIERRDEDIDVGQQRVLEALSELPDAPLAEQLEKLVNQMHDPSRSDDVAALALLRVPST